MYLTASNVQVEASVEPGSAGSSSARRDKHSAGARRRREEPFAVTLQFECLHGAMMLEAAGGISSHTHTYFWILASLLHRQGYMLLSCSAPHLHEHEKHLLSSQTTTTTKKKAEHVCHSRRDPLQRAIILCCFVCFFFVFSHQSASDRSEMAASRHLLSLQFLKQTLLFLPTLAIWEFSVCWRRESEQLLNPQDTTPPPPQEKKSFFYNVAEEVFVCCTGTK